jgi:alpha-ketoglutarate-dependent sulfate ester dioxygenase
MTLIPSQVGLDGSLAVQPLQPTIGAEIEGVDLRYPLSEAMRDQIKAAILEYKVVFFRDQDIDRDQHAAFARQFGSLYAYPIMHRPYDKEPSIHQVTTAADPKNMERLAELRRPHGWDPYHSDTSWLLVPTWGAVLRAVTLPEVGGDTIWVDTGLAYDELPGDVKQRLDGLHVTHDFREVLLNTGYDYPIVAHPIVRIHRETGRKMLFVNYNNRPWIVGLDQAESKELLTLVHDQFRRPEYQVRFSWRPGSVAFWDNRATVHYGVRNYGDVSRVLERILIGGEPEYDL